MSTTPTLPPLHALPTRRRLLQGGAALLTAHPLLRSLAQQPPAAGGEPPRLALLIGNRDYPEGEDLPPIHKNVRDLRAVLEKRGFTVDEGLDLDLAQSRAALQAFAAKVRAAPPDCTALFYFSGHGAQVDAENLLVAARANPKARPEVLLRNSLTLTGDVLGPLPDRPAGLTIAVIDACRTSLRDVARGDGLNQVEAPPGKLIAFATGAGRPAIAPADDTRHTFYTGSLVKLLETASGEISFSDLFRLVKYDVQNTMLNHPVPLLRRFAQFPFIAENTQVRRRLAPLPPPEVVAAGAPPPRPRDEAEDFARLDGAIWPAEVARLADEYLKNHAASPLAGSAIVAREGAREAVKALGSRDVKLFRSAFAPPGDAASRLDELAKAGRGDKDAAARIARSYGRRDSGRYEGWLQYATELGNGIAAYELALHYRREAQPLLADRYEKRALDLGYTPPPSLDNTRK
ncbi:MAG: caspase family protein [Rubrivivax sp.]|nr:caspase family protein [Rubrivivax sp.]